MHQIHNYPDQNVLKTEMIFSRSWLCALSRSTINNMIVREYTSFGLWWYINSWYTIISKATFFISALLSLEQEKQDKRKWKTKKHIRGSERAKFQTIGFERTNIFKTTLLVYRSKVFVFIPLTHNIIGTEPSLLHYARDFVLLFQISWQGIHNLSFSAFLGAPKHHHQGVHQSVGPWAKNVFPLTGYRLTRVYWGSQTRWTPTRIMIRTGGRSMLFKDVATL